MRSPRFCLMLFCLACCNSIFAQESDSVFITSTIHVAKPMKKAYVEVSQEYAVFMSDNDAPKLGSIKGSKLKYIKSKDLRSFGQNEENPEPIINAIYFKNKKDTAIVSDGPRNYYIRDSIADLSTYLEGRTIFTFPPEANRIDTIQLKVVLDKKGKYRYNFASKNDSLNEGGAKCMEALTSINKWQPAHVFRSRKGNSQRKPKRLKAHSEILITVVLSPYNFKDLEESTKGN